MSDGDENNHEISPLIVDLHTDVADLEAKENRLDDLISACHEDFQKLNQPCNKYPFYKPFLGANASKAAQPAVFLSECFSILGNEKRNSVVFLDHPLHLHMSHTKIFAT